MDYLIVLAERPALDGGDAKRLGLQGLHVLDRDLPCEKGEEEAEGEEGGRAKGLRHENTRAGRHHRKNSLDNHLVEQQSYW